MLQAKPLLALAFLLAACTAPAPPEPARAPAATAPAGSTSTVPATVPGGSPSVQPPVPLERVDKSHSLPADYVPPLAELGPEVPATNPGLRVRDVAYEPLRRMLADSRDQGLAIFVVSPYRSYDEQAAIFAAYATRVGETEANRFSARPGQSEHQLGTAIDFSSPAAGYDLVQAFDQTPEGQWLRSSAWQYGFVMSYPEGKENVTGYVYEPWHFRYVGKPVADELNRKGITLTEYLSGR